MTRALWVLGVAVAVLFGLAVLANIARHRRLREEGERLERLIRPVRYRDGMRKADESLPKRSAERRALADAKRQEAALLASGQQVQEDGRADHDSHPLPRLLSVDRRPRVDAAAAAMRRVRKQG